MPANNNTIQKTVAQLLRSAGVDTPSQVPVVNNTTEFSTFSQKEFRNILTNRANRTISSDSTIESMFANITQSATNAESWMREIDELKVLTPEIDDAADIVVSSIFSPTDMQTNALSVITENTGLGTQTEEEINKILTNFFNDKDNLAERAARWVRDARYGSGGTGVVLIPSSNIRNLNAMSDVKDKNLYAGNNFNDISISTEVLQHNFEASLEQSSEAWIPSNNRSSMEALDEKLIQAAEEASASALDEINEKRKAHEKGPFQSYDIVHSKDLAKAMKDLFVDNKTIRFYNDVTVFEKSMKYSEQSIDKVTRQAFERCFGNNATTRMYALDPEFDLGNKDNVVVMEFPTATIIPICVPNEPSKHLAYIAIVDQWGTPLGKGFIDDFYRNGSRSLNEANKRSMTGKTFAQQFNGEVSDQQQFEISANLFTAAMKIMIKTKMQEYGLGNIDIQTHSAIGSCLFRYLLKDNKIGMIFIPASFVVYTAFDYHKNGTGKSLLEDISTIIALRNTLTMAGIMAAAENSINNRTIEVNVDEKNTNPLQTLEMVRNMYIDKKVVKLNHNPMDIQRGLYNKALTLLPKNLRGIREGLTTTVEHRSTNAVQPDENLRELLTKWLIQKLRVPNSVMNNISDNEFSRSVAITNLHFNNELHNLQRVVESFMSRYVRIFTTFSTELQEELRTVIKNVKRTDNEIKDQKNAIDGKFDEKIDFNDAGTIDKYIGLIISNMKIDLPKPRAVVDKAQYSEIDQYIQTIERVINDVYPDESINQGEYKSAYTLIKSKIKSDYIRKFIQEVGFHSNYELPNIDEVSVDSIQNMLISLINTQRMVNATTKLIGEPLNSADGDGSNLRDHGNKGGGEETDQYNEETNPEGEMNPEGTPPEETPTEETPAEGAENPNALDENGNLPGETQEEEIPNANPTGPVETGGAEEPGTPLNENGETPEETEQNAPAEGEAPAKPGRKRPTELEFPEEANAQPPKY